MVRSRRDLPARVVKASFHFVAASSKAMCKIVSERLIFEMWAGVAIVLSFGEVSKVCLERRYRWRSAHAVGLPGG